MAIFHITLCHAGLSNQTCESRFVLSEQDSPPLSHSLCPRLSLCGLQRPNGERGPNCRFLARAALEQRGVRVRDGGGRVLADDGAAEARTGTLSSCEYKKWTVESFWASLNLLVARIALLISPGPFMLRPHRTIFHSHYCTCSRRSLINLTVSFS